MTHRLGKLLSSAALLAVLAASSAWAGEAAQTATQEDRGRKAEADTTKTFPLDQVVVKVGGQQATVGDVEFASHFLPREIQGEMATEGRAALGREYVRLMTLTQEAARQHLDDSPDYRRRMELARMQWLSQAEFKKLNDEITVSEADIKQDYEAHQSDYAEILVREVSIRKKSGKGDTGPGLSLDAARAKAAAIRQAILSGTDFSKVATQFEKPGEIYFDLKPRAIRHDQLPAKAERQVFALKDGELSDVADELQALSFVQVVKHTTASLQDEEQAIRVKLRHERIAKAISDLEKGADAWMDPIYFAPLNHDEQSEAKAEDAGHRDR